MNEWIFFFMSIHLKACDFILKISYHWYHYVLITIYKKKIYGTKQFLKLSVFEIISKWCI